MHALPFAAALVLGTALAATVTLAAPEANCGSSCALSAGKGGHGKGHGDCCKAGAECCQGGGSDCCAQSGHGKGHGDCCKAGAECCQGGGSDCCKDKHGAAPQPPAETAPQPDPAGALHLPDPITAEPAVVEPSEASADTGLKSVHFGVVLISYAGAQDAERGARSKADAEALAQRLQQQAQGDFAAAVAQGDSGSIADAGKMGRGVLETEVESALFSLAPGAVSKVVSTPRGFWIMKRID